MVSASNTYFGAGVHFDGFKEGWLRDTDVRRWDQRCWRFKASSCWYVFQKQVVSNDGLRWGSLRIGIALLNGNPEDMQKIMKAQMEQRRKQMLEQQEALRKKWGLPPNPNTNANVTNENQVLDPNSPEARQKKINQQAAKLEERMAKLMDDTDQEPPTLKFGDASVAAPFTSKLATVESGM